MEKELIRVMRLLDIIQNDIEEINKVLRRTDRALTGLIKETNIGIPTREFGHCSDGAISKECQRLHHPCLGNEDYADEDR